jgi:hypothetical protein
MKLSQIPEVGRSGTAVYHNAVQGGRKTDKQLWPGLLEAFGGV